MHLVLGIILPLLLGLPLMSAPADSACDVSCHKVDSLFDRVYAVKQGYWSSTDFDESNLMAMFFKQFETAAKRELELKLDVYSPAGPVFKPRPVIVFLHGGAFYVNGKGNLLPGLACEHYARKGYVAVSMDYRMGFTASKKSIREAQDAADEDLRCALRYLCDSAGVFGIDTTKIVVGGSSSGAMISMRVAFQPDGTFPPLAGVIDMWGAIKDLSILDNADIPLIAFHGNIDKIVPYTEGYPVGGKTFMDYLYGSARIVEYLQKRGKDARLVTFLDRMHSPCFDKADLNENYPLIIEEIDRFLARVCPVD